MFLLHRVFVSVTAACILAVLYADAATEIGADCLGCLCMAATTCNETTQCQTPKAGGYFCGPFHMSWAYWADAGKPVLLHDNPIRQGAFEDCATDLVCAAKVVTNYINRFAKEGDCNGDGKIDCVDFAYMHKLGGYSCRDASPINTAFYERFDKCWRVVQAALPQPFTIPAS